MEENPIERIKKAKIALESIGCKEAYELLAPLLDKRDPAAMFLYSTFSISEVESESNFEKRRINLLRLASEAGYAPAIYELAVCYDLGDLVEKNSTLASTLYEKAAKAGYAKAKLYHGLNLFYGSHGVKKNELEGLSLIKQAADEDVDDANEILVGLSN